MRATNEAHKDTVYQTLATSYTKAFFERGRTGSARSASKIVPELIRLLSPNSVVDVGCGIGTWTRQFQVRGIDDILGVDGPHVPKDVLEIDDRLFFVADLSAPLNLGRTFDLALTVEVAEHLPESRARTFIADLARLAPAVAFSAAIPGQSGTHHINEQWPDYWEKHFAEFDYVAVDCLRPQFWDDPDIEFWYKQNLVLYVNRFRLAKYPKLDVSAHASKLLRLVHPELHRRTLMALNVASGFRDIDGHLSATLSAVAQVTRTSPHRMLTLCDAVRYLIQSGIPGDMVECGPGIGGDAIAMGRSLSNMRARGRDIYLFDIPDTANSISEKDISFDGHRARSLVHGNGSYLSSRMVESIFGHTGCEPTRMHYVQCDAECRFACRLPKAVALLSLRTNWYQTTRQQLELFFPRMHPGAILLIDGYGFWKGCRDAVDEYFAERGVFFFVTRVDFSARVCVTTGGTKRTDVRN